MCSTLLNTTASHLPSRFSSTIHVSRVCIPLRPQSRQPSPDQSDTGPLRVGALENEIGAPPARLARVMRVASVLFTALRLVRSGRVSCCTNQAAPDRWACFVIRRIRAARRALSG